MASLTLSGRLYQFEGPGFELLGAFVESLVVGFNFGFGVSPVLVSILLLRRDGIRWCAPVPDCLSNLKHLATILCGGGE